MVAAEKEPSMSGKSQGSAKKITKKQAMPIDTSKPMNMADIIKLQEESKVPINLNI
jgi:hypothetical protein